VSKTKPSVTVELNTWLFKDNNTKGLQSGIVEVSVEARADLKRTITAPVLDNGRLMYVSLTLFYTS